MADHPVGWNWRSSLDLSFSVKFSAKQVLQVPSPFCRILITHSARVILFLVYLSCRSKKPIRVLKVQIFVVTWNFSPRIFSQYRAFQLQNHGFGSNLTSQSTYSHEKVHNCVALRTTGFSSHWIPRSWRNLSHGRSLNAAPGGKLSAWIGHGRTHEPKDMRTVNCNCRTFCSLALSQSWKISVRRCAKEYFDW